MYIEDQNVYMGIVQLVFLEVLMLAIICIFDAYESASIIAYIIVGALCILFTALFALSAVYTRLRGTMLYRMLAAFGHPMRRLLCPF